MGEYGKRKWGTSATEFYAYGKEMPGINTPDQFREEGARPHAEIRLNHATETPNHHYSYSKSGAPHHYGALGSDAPNELFEHTPAQIMDLNSHPDMKIHVGTLLGLAINEHRKRENNPDSIPTPSADLSTYSSNMIKKARAKGTAIPVNHDNEHSDAVNGLFSHNTTMSKREMQHKGIETLDDSERQAGKSTFREIIRKRKPSNVSKQQFKEHFTQGELF
jgi:hypothetical protein